MLVCWRNIDNDSPAHNICLWNSSKDTIPWEPNNIFLSFSLVVAYVVGTTRAKLLELHLVRGSEFHNLLLAFQPFCLVADFRSLKLLNDIPPWNRLEDTDVLLSHLYPDSGLVSATDVEFDSNVFSNITIWAPIGNSHISSDTQEKKMF